MSAELIVIIAALCVSWLVFTLLVNLLKLTIQTAILIAAVVLILQLLFGIGAQDLWQQIIQLPQTLWQLVTGQSGSR